MLSPHVHIPFEKIDNYLSFIRDYKLNLEIFFQSETIDSITPKDIMELKEKLDYNPALTVHGPFMDLCPGAVDPKVREVTIERFSRTMEIIEPLSPLSVVFHSGYEKWKYGLRTDIWLEGSLRMWQRILDASAGSDIKIAIENIFEDGPLNLRLLMENMGRSERFGLCFDTGHFNLFSKEPLSQWLDALKPYIIELHLHDNKKDFDSHLAVGDGTFDFNGLFTSLGRMPICTVEAHTPENALKSIERIEELIKDA